MALNSPQEILRIFLADVKKNPPLRIIISIIALLIAWTSFLSLEPWLRWCGMTLQLCGFYLVYLSIDKRRRSFGGRELTRSLRNWLCLIFVRPQPITASLQATEIGADVFVRRARVSQLPRPDASLEERLELIEQARFDIQRELDTIWEKIDAVETDLTASINRESANWSAKTSATEEKFADAIAGDIHIDLFGVWLFGLGVAIASASVEIKGFIDWLAALPSI